MDIKAISFAALGVFVAMTAAVLLMKGDVARMREQEAAALAKECAAKAAQVQPADTGSMDAVAPVDPLAAAAAPVDEEPDPCADVNTSGAGAPMPADGVVPDPNATFPADSAATGGDQYATDEYATDPSASGEYSSDEYVDPAASGSLGTSGF